MSQIETDVDKNSKFQVLRVFLTNFRHTSWLRMLKTFQKEKFRRPKSGSEEINEIFKYKKTAN